MLPDQPASDEVTTQYAYAAPLHYPESNARPFQLLSLIGATLLGYLFLILGTLLHSYWLGVPMILAGIAIAYSAWEWLKFDNPTAAEAKKYQFAVTIGIPVIAISFSIMLARYSRFTYLDLDSLPNSWPIVLLMYIHNVTTFRDAQADLSQPEDSSVEFK